jgi:hypothetical protein
MMLRVADIVNPFIASEKSDHKIAQPITFESMRVAHSFAHNQVDVQLYSAQFPEDRGSVPSYFQCTRDLERSVLDVARFRIPRKLPLLQDILQRLYETTDADCLIYTNVDVALMPSFYLAVARWVEQGIDSLVINRRVIPRTHNGRCRFAFDVW